MHLPAWKFAMHMSTFQTSPHHLLQRLKTIPFFKDCLSAIDSTHILAHVPEHEHACYRNHKGDILQNILAVCLMDMRSSMFYLDGTGVELILDACATDFHVLLGKHCLADAGFLNCDTLLVPSRAVRYPLKEWGSQRDLQYVLGSCSETFSQGPRLQNEKEVLNLNHARAWNIIERIFGAMKKHYKILFVAPEYSVHTQACLVCGLVVMHNLICIHNPQDMHEPLQVAHNDSHSKEKKGRPSHLSLFQLLLFTASTISSQYNYFYFVLKSEYNSLDCGCKKTLRKGNHQNQNQSKRVQGREREIMGETLAYNSETSKGYHLQ